MAADIMSLLFSCFLGRERRTSGDATPRNDMNTTNTREGQLQSEIVYVELLKQNNEPLGLKLEGGTDHDQLVRVSNLHPGGVAFMSNALQIGDRVLSINGTVTDRLTHSEVVALLENSGNIVNLEIAFDAPLNNGSPKLDDGMGLKTAFIAIAYDDNSIFPGFVITGGRLENRSITVSHVKQGSYPYKKGILRAGDRILQINHIDMRNASRSEADQLLVPSENGCTLQIEYDVPIHDGLEATSGPLIVELLKPHGASLGISLSEDRAPGEPIMISRVREAGIADRSGVLHYGDRLLSVNGQHVYDKTVQEVRHLLSHSGITVKLEIMLAHHYSERPGISPFEDGASDVSSRTSQCALVQPLVPPTHEINGPIVNNRKPSQLSLASSIEGGCVSVGGVSPQGLVVDCHPQVMSIDLIADPIGYGMEIEGGSEGDYCSFPVTISNIIPGGPAALLGRLMVGDRILSINGESLCDVSLDHASKLIKEADDTLQMEIEFDVTDTGVVPNLGTFEVSLVKSGFLNLGLSIRRSGDTVWISDLKKGGIAHRSGALQAGDILLAVNGVSVVNATPHEVAALLTERRGEGEEGDDTVTLVVKRETTNNFMPVNKPAQPKPSPVIYSVELNSNGESLGISLDGSEQPGQPIVISEIREGGVAHRTGAIKIGDRIIAINGESLLTKSVQDACTILQTSGGNTVTLKISKGVIRRRSRARVNAVNKYRTRYNNRFKNSRFPSQTSESELSASFTSLEGSTHQLSRHSKQGRGFNPPGHTQLGPGGRHSPVRRSGGRGRLSPAKERSSPNRDRNVGGAKMGVVNNNAIRRFSFTETTDDEFKEEERGGRKGNVKSPLAETHSKVSDIEPRPLQQLTTFEENMLETIHRSEGFTKKLRNLAAQSGSEESDQEFSLPPRLFRDNRLPYNHTHIMDPIYSSLSHRLIEVHIIKDKGFGFSLSDGLDTPGVFINQIDPKGPAATSGLLPFDQIIKVNGLLVQDYDCCKVRPLFLQADTVLLTVARSLPSPAAATGATPIPPNLQVYPSSITTDDDT